MPKFIIFYFRCTDVLTYKIKIKQMLQKPFISFYFMLDVQMV